MGKDKPRIGIHTRLQIETEDRRGQASFEAIVTNVLGHELWLAARRAEAHFPHMVPRQPLHLGLESPDGPLVIETTFARYLTGLSRDDRSRVFAVSWHEEVEAHTRAHVRVDLERPVHLRVPEGRAGRGASARGETINLSADGALLSTAMMLTLSQPVLMVLELSPTLSIPAAARVVRIDLQDGRMTVAVHFERISSLHREQIASYLLREKRLCSREAIAALDRTTAELGEDPAPQPPPPSRRPSLHLVDVIAPQVGERHAARAPAHRPHHLP